MIEEVLEENANNTVIKSNVKDGVEESENYPRQRFRASVQFVNETINIASSNKAFNQFKKFEVVVGFIVGWSETTRLEFHQIAKATKHNLPEYLQQPQQLPPIKQPG